jgi:hypothetical protein
MDVSFFYKIFPKLLFLDRVYDIMNQPGLTKVTVLVGFLLIWRLIY